METSEIVRALREVPEVRLRLIEVAWKVTGDDGQLDYDVIRSISGALQEAFSEAREYVQSTRETVWALKQIARS